MAISDQIHLPTLRIPSERASSQLSYLAHELWGALLSHWVGSPVLIFVPFSPSVFLPRSLSLPSFSSQDWAKLICQRNLINSFSPPQERLHFFQDFQRISPSLFFLNCEGRANLLGFNYFSRFSQDTLPRYLHPIFLIQYLDFLLCPRGEPCSTFWLGEIKVFANCFWAEEETDKQTKLDWFHFREHHHSLAHNWFFFSKLPWGPVCNANRGKANLGQPKKRTLNRVDKIGKWNRNESLKDYIQSVKIWISGLRSDTLG